MEVKGKDKWIHVWFTGSVYRVLTPQTLQYAQNLTCVYGSPTSDSRSSAVFAHSSRRFTSPLYKLFFSSVYQLPTSVRKDFLIIGKFSISILLLTRLLEFKCSLYCLQESVTYRFYIPFTCPFTSLFICNV